MGYVAFLVSPGSRQYDPTPLPPMNLASSGQVQDVPWDSTMHTVLYSIDVSLLYQANTNDNGHYFSYNNHYYSGDYFAAQVEVIAPSCYIRGHASSPPGYRRVQAPLLAPAGYASWMFNVCDMDPVYIEITCDDSSTAPSVIQFGYGAVAGFNDCYDHIHLYQVYPTWLYLFGAFLSITACTLCCWGCCFGCPLTIWGLGKQSAKNGNEQHALLDTAEGMAGHSI